MNCAKAENTTTGRGRDGDAWSEQLLQRARATPKATMPARALTLFERAALEVLAGVLSIPKTIQYMVIKSGNKERRTRSLSRLWRLRQYQYQSQQGK
jgi:hypothetical protein